ncbi:MAG: ankyrin repeat domain-containing protein [Candidatus Amoebophilus sp.]
MQCECAQNPVLPPNVPNNSRTSPAANRASPSTSGSGKPTSSSHTTEPIGDLNDSIISAIQDDLLRDTVKALKAGNKENLQKDNDTTYQVLSAAVREPQNNVLILKYLLEKGKVNVDTPIDYGATVLVEAVASPSDSYKHEVVKSLLENGANPNAPDNYNRTPLDWAIFSNNLDAVKLLVEAGGDCNAVCGEYGYRPLHQAAVSKNIDTVKYLLQKGADKGLLNSNGEKPYQCTSDPFIKQLLTP